MPEKEFPALNRRDREARSKVATMLNTDETAADSLRLGVSDVIAETCLHGLKGLLGSRGKKHYWGIPWSSFQRATDILQKIGIEPNKDNLVSQLTPGYQKRYREFGRHSRLAGGTNANTHIVPQGRITFVQGGGMGVAGKGSHRSRGI